MGIYRHFKFDEALKMYRGNLGFYEYALQIKHIAKTLEDNPDNLNPVFFSSQEFEALKDLVYTELSIIETIEDERADEFKRL